MNELYYDEENPEQSRSRFVVSYLIDLTIEKTLESCSSQDILNSQKIKNLCREMESIDAIRQKYWQFVFKVGKDFLSGFPLVMLSIFTRNSNLISENLR